MVKLQARAPVRIDFCGGTTDVYPFTKYGGAVLNAGISHYVIGSLTKLSNKTVLEYHSDLPTSSGLGTSSAMNVVWLALTTGVQDKLRIAKMAFELEKATGVVGGKQDQYAAALGGINFLTFNDGEVGVERLKLRKPFIERLEKGLFLEYTGPRISSDVNAKIINRVRNNDKKTITTMKQIVENTEDMRDVMLKGDLDGFCYHLNREWELRKSLHPGLTTPKIEKAIGFAMKNGAMAAKVCGAGGGGSILFFADDKKSLMKRFNNPISFKFDISGLKIWR